MAAAAATMSNSTSLNVTLAHAVSYLTTPLATSPSSPYSSQTILALQLALENNLAAVYAQSWCPQDPLRGSGRRCLSFAPGQLPPRPVYAACRAAGIDWPEWMRCLGGREFDLFVDPGCVSVRLGPAVPGAFASAAAANPRAHLVTVWSAEMEAQMEAQQEVEMQLEALRLKQRELELQQMQLQLQAQKSLQQPPAVPMATKPKTLAQRLIEADGEDEDALFSLLADEIRQPTWMTPILEQFPVVPVPLKHTAAAFVPSQLQNQQIAPTHSRSSSRSSTTSSSGFSYISDDSTVSSCASLSSVGSTTSMESRSSLSRRDRSRQSNVYVDRSKTEVTPYDGGKTTVLTGGVMLGSASARKPGQQRRF